MGCNVSYSQPHWDELASRKHRVSGAAAQKKWDRSILRAETADGEESLYNPHLTRDQIEHIEMRCVEQPRSDDWPDGHDGIVPTNKCHFRRFYKKLDDEIGASNGV